MNLSSVKIIIVKLIACLIPSRVHRKNWREKTISDITGKLSRVEYGYGNRIVILDSDGRTRCAQDVPGLKIIFKGTNSLVELQEPFYFVDSCVTLGNNAIVKIDKSIYPIRNLTVTNMDMARLHIGENFACNGCLIENHDEPGLMVDIGNDCLFSYGIKIRVSDGHTIYDNNSMLVINKPKNGVKIGNHVWIGADAFILKDSVIPDNTVVGARSLISNKVFAEKNTVLAGTPARVVRRDVNWDRKSTSEFEQNMSYLE